MTDNDGHLFSSTSMSFDPGQGCCLGSSIRRVSFISLRKKLIDYKITYNERLYTGKLLVKELAKIIQVKP
jgi:hypothetical protein